jgi:hypothetical protein
VLQLRAIVVFAAPACTTKFDCQIASFHIKQILYKVDSIFSPFTF